MAGETHHPLRYGRFPLCSLLLRRPPGTPSGKHLLPLVWQFVQLAAPSAAACSPRRWSRRDDRTAGGSPAGLTASVQIAPSARISTPGPPHLCRQGDRPAEVGPATRRPPGNRRDAPSCSLAAPSGPEGLVADDRSAPWHWVGARATTAADGVDGKTLYLRETVRLSGATERMLASVMAADLVILSFPLYVDCLPAPRSEHSSSSPRVASRSGAENRRQTDFFALCQSGFPEAEQSSARWPSAAVSRRGRLRLARRSRRRRRPRRGGAAKAGGIARHVVPALDAAARPRRRRAVPADVVQRAAKPICGGHVPHGG